MGLLLGDDSVSTARDGTLMIVQEKYDALLPAHLMSGQHLNNRFGRFSHDDLVGKPLGRRWEAVSHPGPGSGSQQCAGFVHALAPTPELWSMAMHHRTQIVYPHDTAIIALYLELRPGCVIVEAGTGSGSASVAFARAVAPSGKVFSFEFHEARAAAAETDFEKLGISAVVKVSHGVNVVNEGFTGVPDGSADAVFLDLPAPYLVVDEIARVLKPNGTVCMFSPCIEQAQRSCDKFRERNFHSVRTITAPVRTYETRECPLEPSGFEKLQGHTPECEMRNEIESDEQRAKKRKRVDSGLNGGPQLSCLMGTVQSAVLENDEDGRIGHLGRVARVGTGLISKPFSFMKGHTSFLTFARRTRMKSEVTTSKGLNMMGPSSSTVRGQGNSTACAMS